MEIKSVIPLEKSKIYYRCSPVQIIILDEDRWKMVEATRYIARSDHNDLIVFTNDEGVDWRESITIEFPGIDVSIAREATEVSMASAPTMPDYESYFCRHSIQHLALGDVAACRRCLGDQLYPPAKGGGVDQPANKDRIDDTVESYIYQDR